MKVTKNCPCVDMEEVKKRILDLCIKKGIDAKEFLEIIDECFIGWFSRSMATALFAFCKDTEGHWCVLASERGEEAADFRGMWNCPCGYLDFDETTKECAVRECSEEVGVKLPSSYLTLVGYEDDPIKANRQNVTFRFLAKIKDKTTNDFTFSKEKNEGKEVGNIAWVRVEDIDSLPWAFNHKERILEIFNGFVKK